MHHPFSNLLIAIPTAPLDAAVLATVLVTVVIAAALLFRTISYCLNDLYQRPTVAGGDKRLWALVIILGGPVGQIFYWLFGRGPN
jgi:hypothetical protein